MNTDQVKAKLFELDGDVVDFTVIFSGKASKKVDGLYHPNTKEMILHNKNFENDDQLMYTAIHEFAHHIQFTRLTVPSTTRAHNNSFWNIFHKLLNDAESKGIYNNIFRSDDRFIAITKRVKEKFMTVNGNLVKEFGNLLMEAHALCVECNACFDDFVDRELGLHRAHAKTMMKMKALDIRPEIGYENMKTVARIRDEEERKDAEKAFFTGFSPDMVKAQFASKDQPESRMSFLMEERDRIEKTIERLVVKIADLEKQIEELKHS